MPNAEKPEDEAKRLAELRRYGVLDTPPEERFDGLTRLAAKILNVPVALVSLVDEDRQWFKSNHGLDVSETPREHAFCAHTLSDKKELLIENALDDKRVADNPLVTGEPNIRFYAGIPLTTPQNHVLGTLCVIDFEQRQFSDEQLDTLRELARQVEVQLEYGLALTELSEANAELLQAKQGAEQLQRAKSEFIASLSHELRTPLNSILGFSQRLLKRVDRFGDKRDVESLLTIERNGQRLLEMINDVIDLARIEAGMVEPLLSKFSTAEIRTEIVKTYEELAAKKGLDFRVEGGESAQIIPGDKERLFKAIGNIVSNAIRYTDKGFVEVTIEQNEVSSGSSELLISVKDSGPGVSKETLPTLFETFSRGDADLNRSGMGLGLAIAKDYVELHGGTLEVQSTLGKGSVFKCQIPLPTEEDSDGNAGAGGAHVNASVRVLCVDDDPDTLKFLKLSFEDEGFLVELARDHDQAISILSVKSPDVVCLDIALPGKDGYEVIRSISGLQGENHTPVIILSALAIDKIKDNRRVVSYLQKPVSSEEISSAVRSVVLEDFERVLVVEDDDDSASLVQSALEDCKLSVSRAVNGKEALEMFEEEKYSAVILDLIMPTMDGTTFLREFRKNKRFDDVPVFILTSKTLSEEEFLFLKKSSSGILTKGKDQTLELVNAFMGYSLNRARATRRANNEV